MSFWRDARYVNQSKAKFLSPIKSRCVSRSYVRHQRFTRSFAIASREINFYSKRRCTRQRELKYGEEWMEKGERGRGGLWYFASSCSIDGALKLINPRRQSASFVLSSILNLSACRMRFTQTRVSSIPRLNRRCSLISWSRLESLPGISRTQRVFLPWSIGSVCSMMDTVMVCTSQRERD